MQPLGRYIVSLRLFAIMANIRLVITFVTGGNLDQRHLALIGLHLQDSHAPGVAPARNVNSTALYEMTLVYPMGTQMSTKTQL